ncbi:hypothetical protein B5F40_04325 [Gordonibacter sp. An230]|nr:hypothetical protein B5F40_04325 [Gordonibacter sp. An230]
MQRDGDLALYPRDPLRELRSARRSDGENAACVQRDVWRDGGFRDARGIVFGCCACATGCRKR